EARPPATPAPGPERAVPAREPTAATPPAPPPGAAVPPTTAAPAVAAVAATAAPEPDLTKLPAEDRTRVLVALDRERLKKISPLLGTILKVCPVEEKLLIVQGFARSGEKADAPKLQVFLTDSDPRLVVAAIEALRDLDPDLLSPHLPRLIQHSSDQVRATAMRVFALFDKKQAISLVEKMLFSLQPKQRALAIFSTGQVDFPSVRDLLLRALSKEQIPENARQICTILRAHLDEELVMSLDGAIATCPEATRDTLEAFFAEAVETLRRENRTRFAGVEEFRQESRKRIAAEEQRQKSAQPSYALKNIQKMRQQKAAEAPKVDAGLVQFTVAAFGIGAVLTALIWFLFLAPAAPPPDGGSTPGRRPVSSPATQVQAPRNIEGVVTEVGVGGQIEVKAEGPEGERFLIECRDSGIPIPAKGSRFRGQVRPTGQEGKVVLAELLAIY
ncbi:MAG: hypothetical protein GX442_20895, partial [Candidatus Riflebacteria bacterium]|nr:hypothetical protein [Candidatus Riflebacteria bacterium]